MTPLMHGSIASDPAALLVWSPRLDLGYYPVKDSPYDSAYWENYRRLDQTEMGEALTRCRVEMVRRVMRDGERLIDVGIGGGRFVEESGQYGTDINPEALKWLEIRGKHQDPETLSPDYLSFWDSLEHIHDPSDLLGCTKKGVFISTPIYEDAYHVLQSKHFKPSEHCWYFTVAGLCNFMRRFGFILRESNWMETHLGREDIGSFYFERAA